MPMHGELVILASSHEGRVTKDIGLKSSWESSFLFRMGMGHVVCVLCLQSRALVLVCWSWVREKWR